MTRGEVSAHALALLRERPHRFGELKAALAVSDARTHGLLARLRAQGLVERTEYGLYAAVKRDG